VFRPTDVLAKAIPEAEGTKESKANQGLTDA
jgi:hypothetical protein